MPHPSANAADRSLRLGPRERQLFVNVAFYSRGSGGICVLKFKFESQQDLPRLRFTARGFAGNISDQTMDPAHCVPTGKVEIERHDCPLKWYRWRTCQFDSTAGEAQIADDSIERRIGPICNT